MHVYSILSKIVSWCLENRFRNLLYKTIISTPFLIHYDDVIMGAMASQITSLILLFTQPFIPTQIKENSRAPRHWPLCGEFTGRRWIPRTMASNAKMLPFHDVIMKYLWPPGTLVAIHYTINRDAIFQVTGSHIFLFVLSNNNSILTNLDPLTHRDLLAHWPLEDLNTILDK